jgi:hypothetical protein
MKLHHFAIVVSTLLAGTLMVPVPAIAKNIAVSGTHSRSDIASHCAAAGGSFDEAGGGYSCLSKDRGTTVSCTGNGKCRAQVPGVRGGNVIGLGSVMTISKTPGAKSTEHPVQHPVSQQRESSHPSKKK